MAHKPHSVLKTLGEIAVSMVAVLMSFMAMVGLLSWSFPQGNSLTQLMRGEGDGLLRRGSRWDYSLGSDRPAFRPQPVIAQLTHTLRRVKDKPATAIAWSDSRTGQDLRNRHSVQTFDRAGATITFPNQTEIVLQEHTLIVLRAPAETEQARGASLVILDGELSATLGIDADQGFEIVMPNGSVEIDGRGAATGDGKLRVTVNEDETSTITVLGGGAKITAGGKTTEITAIGALTIDKHGNLGPPLDVPYPPRPELPEDSRRISFRTTPPAVQFEWDAQPAADGYRIEIARDPDFEEVAYQGKVDGPSFEHGKLPEGTYYWRVTGMNGWAAGEASEPRVLELYQDLIPPSLAVDFPEETTTARRQVTLRGRTEVDARVYVEDTVVAVSPDGTFEAVVTLKPGVNIVVVESFDPAGNVSYASRLITASF